MCKDGLSYDKDKDKTQCLIIEDGLFYGKCKRNKAWG